MEQREYEIRRQLALITMAANHFADESLNTIADTFNYDTRYTRIECWIPLIYLGSRNRLPCQLYYWYYI